MMKAWLKLLPFFVVAWIARKYCSRQIIDKWIYVQPFGPGTTSQPEEIVLIELNASNRNE